MAIRGSPIWDLYLKDKITLRQLQLAIRWEILPTCPLWDAFEQGLITFKELKKGVQSLAAKKIPLWKPFEKGVITFNELKEITACQVIGRTLSKKEERALVEIVLEEL